MERSQENGEKRTMKRWEKQKKDGINREQGDGFKSNHIVTAFILNVCGLNTPIKRQRLSEQIKRKIQLYAVYKKLILNLKTYVR